VGTSWGGQWWDNKKDEVAEKRALERKIAEMKKNRAKADLQVRHNL